MNSSSHEVLIDPYAAKEPQVWWSYFNPTSPFFNVYDRFSQWRRDLGLPHPGTVENLQREVKGLWNVYLYFFSLLLVHYLMLYWIATHLSNYIFDGARADLTKGFSGNPLFQVTHSFALGSATNPSSYNFGAIFASEKVFHLLSC